MCYTTFSTAAVDLLICPKISCIYSKSEIMCFKLKSLRMPLSCSKAFVSVHKSWQCLNFFLSLLVFSIVRKFPVTLSIILYTDDSALGFFNTYLLDRDLSSGERHPLFNKQGPGNNSWAFPKNKYSFSMDVELIQPNWTSATMQSRVPEASLCLSAACSGTKELPEFLLLRSMKTKLQINCKHRKNQCTLVLCPAFDV